MKRSSTPHASGQRRLLAVLLIALALGALVVVGFGAAADRGEGVRYVGTGEGPTWEAPEIEEPSLPELAPEQEQSSPPAPQPRPGGRVALRVLLGLGALALVALAIWVWLRMRALSAPAPDEAGMADADLEQDALSTQQARSALEEARERLSAVVDAHDAVIAAWLALERAIAAAGVRRRPSQTTLEFVVAVLAAVELERAALQEIAHLYRRALFDPAPLTEPDRRRALQLLETLLGQLDDVAERSAR